MERVRVLATGAAIGFVAGICAPVAFVAALVRNETAEWSMLTNPTLVPYWALLVALATATGAFGAWDCWRSGLRRARRVAWAPALLFLWPATEWAQNPSDSKTWGVVLLVVAILAPFVWMGGRIGQEIGVRAARTRRTSAP